MATARKKDAIAALVEEVRRRFGPKVAVTDADEIEPWLTDWRGRFRGEARAILAPGATEEVAAIVRLAADNRVALVPQGGNTSMVGGATPPEDGSALILSLRRMRHIRAVRPDAAGNVLTTCTPLPMASLMTFG